MSSRGLSVGIAVVAVVALVVSSALRVQRAHEGMAAALGLAARTDSLLHRATDRLAAYRADADSARVAAERATAEADAQRRRATLAQQAAQRWREALATTPTAPESLTVALAGWAAETERGDALALALDTTRAALDASRALHARLASLVDSTVLALQTSRRASDRLTAALRASDPPCRVLPGLRCPGRRVSFVAGALAGVGAVWLVRSAAR